MSAAVWADGAIIWQGGAGHRDIAANLPATPDTLYRLASVSKLFAATAAAKLAETGQIRLDAPVAEQLGWLDADWPPLTPRQLAAHISGLPHYQEQDEARGQRRYANGREAVGIFAGRALLAPPGARYAYSSWGYTLLGALIEEKSGMAFPAYIARAIAPGLPIQQDATDGPDPLASRAYAFVNGAFMPQPSHDFSYSWAGGGLSGTAAAVASFGGRMIAGEVVSPATFDAMLLPTRLSDGQAAGERDYHVGLGWRVSRDYDGENIVHHSGTAIGARSTLVVWRASRTAVSLLSNASWVSRIEPTAQMLAAPFREPSTGLTPARCPLGATHYRGTFGDQSIVGTASFHRKRGQCRGEISQHSAMAGWFNKDAQRTNSPLVVIGVHAGLGLARAGLVHPFGISDLRAQPDGSFVAQITETRTLTLRFDQPAK